MGERSSYSHGTFSWVDLVTEDPTSSQKFYQKLFGWEFIAEPAGDSTYYMATYRGKSVAALFALTSEMKSQGVPSHWQSYITVQNLNETVGKAREFGGKVFVEPFDVMEAGRMAVIEEPTGAAVCFWEAKNSIGAELVNEPNTLCWNEVCTRDPETVREFFTKVLGWSYHIEESPMPYTSIKTQDGRQNGGVFDISGHVPDQVPSHVMAYFNVDDLKKSRALVEDLGGTFLTDIVEIPDIGPFFGAKDPQGAPFTLIQLSNPDP